MTLANQDNNLIIESLMKIIERYSSDETNVIKSIKPDFINKIEKLLTQKNITLAISGESASGKSTFVESIQDYISFLQEFS